MATEPTVPSFDGPDLIELTCDGTIPEDDGFRLEPLLRAYLESLNDRPSTRKVGVFSPSGLYRCARGLYYQRTGIAPKDNVDAKNRLTLDIGKAVHKMLNGYMAEMFSLEEASVELQVVYEDLSVEGETDLLIHANDKEGRLRRVIDFKTINCGGWQRLAPPRVGRDGTVTPSSMEGYVWQLYAYAAATNSPLMSLFYVNKCASEILEYSFPFVFALWERIDDKLSEIRRAASLGEPPPHELSKWECPRCRYYSHCKPPGIWRGK